MILSLKLFKIFFVYDIIIWLFIQKYLNEKYPTFFFSALYFISSKNMYRIMNADYCKIILKILLLNYFL